MPVWVAPTRLKFKVGTRMTLSRRWKRCTRPFGSLALSNRRCAEPAAPSRSRTRHVRKQPKENERCERASEKDCTHAALRVAASLLILGAANPEADTCDP